MAHPITSRLRALLVPSLPDLLFIAILIWMLVGRGSAGLLGDGDTGWHIRNGERILHSRSVPVSDPFGFGTEGHAWFAWEWLADAIFAILHAAAGLKAVVLAAAVIVAATERTLFRHCSDRGVNPMLTLCLVFIGANASSIHYLARPHVFTLLFLAVSARLLDDSRAAIRQATWMLPVMAVIWTNLHGGFLALFTLLAAHLVQHAVNRSPWRVPARMGITAMLCFAATFINPYGWHLYAHLWSYLRSDSIRQSVQEFQSPRFGTESMWWFEILLALGIAVMPRLIARRRFAHAIIIAFWAHQALVSVRHVPIYCLLALPPIAVELNELWSAWATKAGRTSVFVIIRGLGEDWRALPQGLSLAPLIAAGSLLLIPGFCTWPSDFPAARFPTAIVSRNWNRIASHSAAAPVRVFSTDQWSDYLIYRLYPHLQTFFDGRSDYFMEWRGDDYRALMAGKPDCPGVLDRENVTVALVPAEWALAGYLRNSSSWRMLDSDSAAILFERR